MGWGSAFTSAWNKASDAVKQKVAQVATTAKQVTNTVATKAQEIAQKTQQKAQFVAQQTIKAAESVKKAVIQSVTGAKKSVTNAVNTVKNQVQQAVQLAKKNIPIIAQQAKQKATQVVQQAKKSLVNHAKKKANKLSKKVKKVFKKGKKIFGNKYVKAVIQVCPLVKDLNNVAKGVLDAIKTAKAPGSLKSKMAKGAGITASTLKSVKDFYDDAKPIYKAIKFSQNPVLAFAKHNVRKLKPSNIVSGLAMDMAVSGLVGGFESLSKNIDRKDISKANLAGRVGFGVAKGAAKPLIATGMAAGTGAIVGAVLGSVIPGAGTIAGATLGAKIGAAFLTPVFDKPAEWVADKLFTDKMEDRAGELGDKTASAVGGAIQGISNFFY